MPSDHVCLCGCLARDQFLPFDRTLTFNSFDSRKSETAEILVFLRSILRSIAINLSIGNSEFYIQTVISLLLLATLGARGFFFQGRIERSATQNQRSTVDRNVLSNLEKKFLWHAGYLLACLLLLPSGFYGTFWCKH